MKRVTLIYGLLICFITAFVAFFESQFQSYNQSEQISDFKISVGKNRKKVIFVLVDALKYDYWSRFGFIKQNMAKNRQGTYLSKVIAGNPTMTTQRVESLMTGSQIYAPGTIIESFFSQKVKIDNIVTQLNNNNRKSLILGDNTWSILFNFTKQYICETTFDIQDFETCDNIVYQNLAQNSRNFDFIVAHFLALDHIGHATSSSTHPKFQLKINLINTYLTYLIQNLDDETIFIMTGDHGMRSDGNHGGLSDDQTQTFLFAYSKQPFLQATEEKRPIRQSDITTTLAILMDIPIPKNSIGVPILQILSNGITSRQIQQMQHAIISKQYKSLIQKASIPCNLVETNIRPQQKIYEVNQECLAKLSKAKPSMMYTFLFLFLLLAIGITLALVIKMSISEHAIWLFTLPIVHFSWFLIRNNSTCLFLFIFAITLFSKNVKPINKLAIFATLITLCQIQPDKVDQYQNCVFQNKLISSIIKSAEFQVLFLTYVFLTYFKQNKNRQQKIINMVVLFLIYFNLMVYYMNTAPLYWLRIGIFAITLAYCCWNAFLVKQNKAKIQAYTFSIEILASLIFGLDGPIVVLSIKAISKLIRHSQFRIQIGFLSAQFVWWILGNRYEYSSIDITKSYLFTQGYNEVLNPICLTLYLMFPYVLSLAEYFHYRNQTQRELFIKVQTQQVDPHQQFAQQNYFQTQNLEQNLDLFKYLSIIVASLISCCINLLLNSQQILFTVVYVPLIVLTAARTIFLIVLVILIHASYFKT